MLRRRETRGGRRGVSVSEVESGKINRERFFWDVAAFAQRLGLMPDPPRRAPHRRLAGPVENPQDLAGGT
jgi:hypothetical protein